MNWKPEEFWHSSLPDFWGIFDGWKSFNCASDGSENFVSPEETAALMEQFPDKPPESEA